MNKSMRTLWLLGAVLMLGLASCGKAAPASPSPAPTPSATPFQPSPTPVPLAAVVNGTPIPLAEFQAEMARFRAAEAEVGTKLAPQKAITQVLDDMIDRMLLAEAAYREGFQPPDDQALWQQAVQEAGSEDALQRFLQMQGYTRESFLQALRQAQAAAWMVQQIAAQVPAQAEQVHARQILVYNEQAAKNILTRLKQGEKFAALAAAYDPEGQGDLGWFPRGYLTQPAVEAAAFSLEVGQVSGIIQTPLGYHIIRWKGGKSVRFPLTPGGNCKWPRCKPGCNNGGKTAPCISFSPLRLSREGAHVFGIY